MKLTRKITLALIPGLVVAPYAQATPTVPYAPSPTSGFASQDADALLKEGSVRALTARECGKLAVNLAESGKPDAAIVAANLGLGVAANDQERGALMATLSLIWGSKRDFRQAADAAQLGQEYLPDDPHLAALREIYYEQAGDGVAALSAQNHLMRLDPNFNRTPVFSIEDADVLIKTTIDAIGLYVAVKSLWADITTEIKQDIRDMLEKIWDGAQSVNEKMQEEAQAIEN